MNHTSLKLFLSLIIIISLTSCRFYPHHTATQEPTFSLGVPPGFYIAEEEKNEYIIPFEFYGMNLMVNANMHGKDIKMLIDNGVMWDELFFYGGPIVDSLEMIQGGNTLVTGAGEGDGIAAKTASNVSIDFGEIHFREQNAVISTKESGFSDFFPGVAGQVCGAFFKHFVVEFNFDTHKLILHKKATYKYKGHGNAIKMTRNKIGSYSVPVNLKFSDKEGIHHHVFIDLGGIDPVALPISTKYGFEKPDSEKIYLGHGASGEINGYVGEIAQVDIAGYGLDEVPAIFVEADNDGDHTNTTIGLPLLMRFNLVFDYFDKLLYLQPNSHFGQSFHTNSTE